MKEVVGLDGSRLEGICAGTCKEDTVLSDRQDMMALVETLSDAFCLLEAAQPQSLNPQRMGKETDLASLGCA
jgi:hypothetical protein